jgi:hypothetical protein
MERYQWILPILEKRLTYAETLKVCPHSQRSLERWVAAYKKFGLAGLIQKVPLQKLNPTKHLSVLRRRLYLYERRLVSVP